MAFISAAAGSSTRPPGCTVTWAYRIGEVVSTAPSTPYARPAISRTRARPSSASTWGMRSLGTSWYRGSVIFSDAGRLTQIWKPSTRPPSRLHPARRHLGVHDPGPGGHPLHIARADHPAVAGGVLVLELALEDVADRLEAPMRVIGCADRRAGV